MNFSQLVTAILFLLAGFGLYLILLNRIVINWVETRFKVFTMVSLMILFTAGPFAFGYAVGDSRWTALPLILIALIAIGETRRAWLRKAFQGDGPVAVENLGITLADPITTLNLATLYYQVAIPRLSMERFRVVHLSDLHVNDVLPKSYFIRVMEEAADLNPDVLIITGDFVSLKKNVVLLPDILAGAKAKQGVFAILGNHDYWSAPADVKKQIRDAEITLLADQCQWVGEDSSVLLCGCEGPWGPRLTLPDPALPRPLTLVLTHTPDNIYRLSQDGIDAVFAGHYHAGQLRLPYLGALVVPSVFGRRFDHGHFVMNGTHLFVSAGIGASRPTFRLYCQPDILVVDFVKGG